MLEIPFWIIYVRVCISVKDNRKRTVKMESTKQSNRKSVEVFLRKSEEEDSFFS